jgi:hypothetical protein
VCAASFLAAVGECGWDGVDVCGWAVIVRRTENWGLCRARGAVRLSLVMSALCRVVLHGQGASHDDTYQNGRAGAKCRACCHDCRISVCAGGREPDTGGQSGRSVQWNSHQQKHRGSNADVATTAIGAVQWECASGETDGKFTTATLIAKATEGNRPDGIHGERQRRDEHSLLRPEPRAVRESRFGTRK